jgi:hypothetical protein
LNATCTVHLAFHYLVMSHVGVTYKTGFGLDLLTPYTFAQLRTTDNTHFPFTVAHALGFSVFTSLIPGNGLITVSLSIQITHAVFFSQPNSFLAIILHQLIPETGLSSVPLLTTSYPGRLASRKSTRLE